MVTPNTPLLISKQSQAALVTFLNQCKSLDNQHWNMREQMRRIDLAYMREADLTSENQNAKASNNLGDPTKFQNVTVPVILPQVEAAVTYQASVFLQGHPIFGVTSNPQSIDEATQMETVIEDQATKGGWSAQLMQCFRDGFKYNLMAAEVSWCRRVTAAMDTDLEFSSKEGKPKEVVWEGNSVKRLDLYNTFWDKRVTPAEVPTKAEFAGYTETYSRIALKQFIQELPDKLVDNVVSAFEAGAAQNDFYIPELNPAALTDTKLNTNTNWLAWANIASTDNKIAYRDSYEVTTLYARILPSDFNLRVPAKNTPQVWKFIFVNNLTLIYAERQTNAHGLIPILFAQPNDDGLAYQTKSLATNVLPIQQITTAMWNSIIAARRRAISDRGLYDPSRVDAAHINNENPSAKIPVRPSAYGKPLNESYFPIPFRDEQSGLLMQETQSLLQMANVISGQNQARQGQFVKGNKTLHEFSTVMNNANGRDQLCSLLLEAQFFTPLKEILKINILQYQGGVSLFNRETEQIVQIDPLKLRKAVLEFKVSDGLLPTDKLINAEALQFAMQVLQSNQMVAAQYNVGPLFTYFLKTQGAHIKEFEKSKEQIAYEQAMMQWQQMVASITESLKGIDPTQIQTLLKQLPPQPQPQQYGYNPAGTDPYAPRAVENNHVNNITNNITGAMK